MKRIFEPEIGSIVKDTVRNCDVLIVNGQFVVDGRISNHWGWKRILSDNTLSKIEHGYGYFAKASKRYSIETIIKPK